MSLPDKIVAYEKSGVLSAVDQSRWEPEMAKRYPENKVYRTLSEKELAQRRAASKKAQEKAVRGKNGRFVKAPRAKSVQQLIDERIAGHRRTPEGVDAWSYAMQCARQMQQSRAIMARLNNHPANTPQPIMGWDFSKSSATPLRRYIPERPWHWHLWMWLKVEMWEKFVLGRQS